MREGPEHCNGWRQRFEIGGERFMVEARHHNRSRNPTGNEMMRQMARGGVWERVQVPEHEWAVTGMGRMLCTLRQAPSGAFHSGPVVFPRKSIMEAAEAAVRRLFPKLGEDAPKPETQTDPSGAEETEGEDHPGEPGGPSYGR